MTNSTAACIHEEWDRDYHMAWDETAKRNAEFIAAANPAVMLALLDELEAAERQNGYLREQRDEWERKAISNFEDCSETAMRIEELESQRQMAFMAGNRWADKFRESANRNAEQADIIAKQEKWIKDVEATMIAATDRAEAAEKRIAELEVREVTLPQIFWYEHDDLSRDVPVMDARKVKKSMLDAGIRTQGED
ncbi:ead/Ea22-like family protein, partial [Huaxiibacter chinensis]|uniref:ead/Ea22-like family protein n=1 Tax=Huaxiibacter chinensis TaxID=2899785 RepID=UPI003D31CB6C